MGHDFAGSRCGDHSRFDVFLLEQKNKTQPEGYGPEFTTRVRIRDIFIKFLFVILSKSYFHLFVKFHVSFKSICNFCGLSSIGMNKKF